MNRVVKTAAMVVLGAAMLGGAIGTTFADDPTPADSAGQGPAVAGRAVMHRGLGPGYSALAGSVGETLGMTPEEIHAERLAGQSLAQIAAAKGVSEAELVEQLLAAREALLQERVAAGTLNLEQADAALEQMQTRIQEGVQRTEIGPNRPANGSGLGLAWGRTDQPGGATGQRGSRAGGPLEARGFGPHSR